MNSKKPKSIELDLGMSCRGGRPSIYARNIIQCGDYASIASIVGEIEDNGKILITPYKHMDQYLNQVKQFLLSINDSLIFANDQPHGQFIDPHIVVHRAKSKFKLMNFEVEQILINSEMQHELYLKAIKYKSSSSELPSEYDYTLAAGTLYPYIQTYSALCDLV